MRSQTIGRGLVVLVIAATLAGGASAATPVAKKPASRPTTARAAKTTPKPALPEARPSVASRTLDDIHIEGEVAVPQVLFITARDQRRFMDFHHRRYLKTSQQLCETTVYPSRMGVVDTPPSDARKEISR